MIYKSLFITLFFLIKLNVSWSILTTEDRMRNLANELRCMVCQNQSLLESDSELAKDLKSLIKEKFNEGKSEQEVKTYLVERYGEFILFKPSFKFSNLLLWLSPILSVLIVGFIAFRKTIILNARK
tara:strand:+ start:1840 stop:2217 length:378 start_codon:yes stop_codon:yes gene_type:complete